MKWKDLTRKEKKKLVDKVWKSIKEDEEFVDFFARFREVHPNVEITVPELFEFMEGE